MRRRLDLIQGVEVRRIGQLIEIENLGPTSGPTGGRGLTR